MKSAQSPELPVERQRFLHYAVRLEIVTLVNLAVIIPLTYLVMATSQAMKTQWVESLLSLLPPIVFLVSLVFRDWPANQDFPYGYHRAVSIGFLGATLALLVLGAILLVDSAITLFRAEHPTIGTATLFGQVIWLGWLMLPVLIWTIVANTILGRLKLTPSRKLHNKVLLADAEMNAADWKTSAATVLGVLGIAVGWWWADALAALIVSGNVLYDGLTRTRACIFDLMDRAPHLVDDSRAEGLPARAATELKKLDWVKDSKVRLRECGEVFFGEAFIAPVDRRNLLTRIAEAEERLHQLDWRLRDVVIQLVAGPEVHCEEGAAVGDV